MEAILIFIILIINIFILLEIYVIRKGFFLLSYSLEETIKEIIPLHKKISDIERNITKNNFNDYFLM